MSGGPRDTAVLSGPERPAWRVAADAATLVMLVVLGAAVASVLASVGHQGFVLALGLAAILMLGLLFGPTHGLLVVAAGLVAYRFFAEHAAPRLDGRTIEVLAVGVVTLSLPWGSRYVAKVSRRRSAEGAPRLVRARAAIEDFVRSRTSDLNWRATLREVRRGLIPFVFLGAGAAGAALLREPAGVVGGVLPMLIAALSVGRVFGARYGFAAGILAAVLLNDVIEPAHAGMAAPTASILVTLVVFAGLGWSVGAMADRLQRKQSALEVLVAASREIATTTDEAIIHRTVFDSLSKLADSSWVESCDDAGEIRLVSDPGGGPPTGAAAQEGVEAWKSRPMTADGRTVGQVRWRFYGLETEIAIANEIAASLIDLGASAVVRARLSIEKSEMEFAARTEHLRTILLDAVSHHFRSPLSGILGSATSILNLPEQHDREVRRELLLIIKEQANRLSRYVDNFLSVARVESGTIDINLADVLLEPLVYDVWETFGEAGGARRFLQVKVDAQPVRADPALLAQVLGNVLENAIKFSPEESIVDVRSRVVGEMLVLEVCDQGIGVKAGSEDHIFRRFFRNPGTKAPGLGLGLYITRSLVQMQGGAVEASNRTDGVTGLKVALTLPVAA